MKKSIHWFRRDLRLDDNTALFNALKGDSQVQCIFIFDKNILDELDKNDARVTFIYDSLLKLHTQLKEYGSSLKVYHGKALEIWKQILTEEEVHSIFCNKDYEPYAVDRDQQVKQLAWELGTDFKAFKDHVIFEESEVVKQDGDPYTVYTPYKRKWLEQFDAKQNAPLGRPELKKLISSNFDFPSLEEIGFQRSSITVPDFDLGVADEYAKLRDIPSKPATSRLGPHLRFGTISSRQIIQELNREHEVFLSELIWREFFIQILFHFPHVVGNSFREQYDRIEWRNKEEEFQKWCDGKTGIGIVDAGMRELNETGFMHNRVRMITASFLTKHLLVDWRWGEAYFAKKLLDFELASNNGNWQWAAGTGCDAAPYFRVFNPETQAEKFDPQKIYIRRWVPEFGTFEYPRPMVDLKAGRIRALETYKRAL